MLEKLLEDISYNAFQYSGEKIIIDKDYVQNKLKDIVISKDLSRYIL